MLRCCDLIASSTVCSAVEGSALSSELVVKRAARIDNPEIIGAREYCRRRKLDILLSGYGRNAARSRDAGRATLCGTVKIVGSTKPRPTGESLTSTLKTPSMASHFRCLTARKD